MNYISVNEASVQWGVSTRRVRQYLASGAIEGALHKGRAWLIPEDALKPDDGRKVTRDSVPYHKYNFPVLLATAAANDVNSLSNEEKLLLKADIYEAKGDYDSAIEAAKKLIRVSKDPFILSGAYFILGVCTVSTGSYETLMACKAKIEELYYPEDFKNKELLVSSLMMVFYQTGQYPDWLKIGRYADLEKDALPWTRVQYVISLVKGMKKEVEPALLEPLCSEADRDNIPVTSLYIHLLLGVLYHFNEDDANASYHLEQALNIAIKTKFYAPVAEFRKSFGLILDVTFRHKNPEAYHHMTKINKEILTGWNEVYDKLSGPYPTKGLSIRETEILNYILKGKRNKEISKFLKISVETVKSVVISIYEKLGVKSRSELKAFFLKTRQQ